MMKFFNNNKRTGAQDLNGGVAYNRMTCSVVVDDDVVIAAVVDTSLRFRNNTNGTLSPGLEICVQNPNPPSFHAPEGLMNIFSVLTLR